ncbi:MAG: hypothetical protein EA396_13940 [Anaerolineaceae bacterium]|nr:MAG: hypothetical protein EA396_13940 [Anaerolineaceae bacterium]
MPGPTLTFAFILATLYGAVFHLIRGGDVRRLALFLLAGWVGFVLGQMTGVMIDFSLFNVGPIRIVPATIGAVAALVFIQVVALRPTKS